MLGLLALGGGGEKKNARSRVRWGSLAAVSTVPKINKSGRTARMGSVPKELRENRRG